MPLASAIQEQRPPSEARPAEQATKYRVTVVGRIFEGADYRRLLAEAVRVWRAHRQAAAVS